MNRHRPRNVWPGALALCLLALAIVPATASAANYHAFLCRIPYGPNAGQPAPTDNTLYTTSGSFVYASQSCGSGGAMSGSIDGGVEHPFGDNGTVTFTTPAGLTVAGFTLWRHTTAAPPRPFGSPVTNIRYTGAATVDGLCAESFGCQSRGTLNPPLDPSNRLAVGNLNGVTQIIWDAACGGAPGNSCPASGAGTLSAQINVLAADITLNDPAPPVASGVGGGLAAGGNVSGTQSVFFNAADGGSGVHRASIVVDGTVVADQVLNANGGACANLGVTSDGLRSFKNTQPCPPSASGLLSLDTAALAPGAHDVKVYVDDAAGNQAVVTATTITTAGAGPAVGSPNGTTASREAKLTARFTSTAKRSRRLGFRRPATVTGTLADAAGNPITGAALIVLTRERRADAQTREIGTVATGPDGTFRFVVPPGPARTVAFAYTAFVGDPAPAAAAVLRTLVKASITGRVTPRLARSGQQIRLSGRLLHLARSGLDIDIQVRAGRRWKTIGEARTRKGGRYTWRYRFPRGQTGSFILRARVQSPLYPFTAGASRPVRVTIRG